MARDYNYWMTSAASHKSRLDQAIADGNGKDILYYRGKYLYDLKQAHKLNPSGYVPASFYGLSSGVYDIADIINHELTNHRKHIDSSIQTNKRGASIKKMTIGRELGLKIRRLATRFSQISFASSPTAKKALKKEAAKDGASLAGSVIKAPFMAAAKVTSALGPLAITICFLPAKVFASLLTITIDAYNGRTSEPSDYNNTAVDQISGALKDGVRKLSKVTYETIGRI